MTAINSESGSEVTCAEGARVQGTFTGGDGAKVADAATASVPVEAEVQSLTLTDPGNPDQIVRYGALVLSVTWSDGVVKTYRLDKRPSPVGRRYRLRTSRSGKASRQGHPDVNESLQADGVPVQVERHQNGRLSLRCKTARENGFTLLGVEGESVELLVFEPTFIVR